MKIKLAIIDKYKDLVKEEILDKLADEIIANEKLKKKLKKYENPNTPPSKQGFDKPQAQGLPVGRKPGKTYNHKRTTRPKDTPNTPPITVTCKVWLPFIQ